MVLEIWSDPEITAETGYEYTRAIQFQCLGGGGGVLCLWVRASPCVIGHKYAEFLMARSWRPADLKWRLKANAGSKEDGITFTGINFLSRVPIVKPLGL